MSMINFFVTFQTDKLVSMFLHRDLKKLIRNQMKLFVKKDFLDEKSSASRWYYYSCVFGKRNYRVLVRVSVCVCVCVSVCVRVCVFA